MQKLQISQNIGVSLVRPRGIIHDLEFNNPFTVQVRRKGRLIFQGHGRNGVTIEGKNHMLDVVFGKSSPVTQVDPWYIGLINDSPSPVLAEADTLASHSGWTETTAYTGNRKAWDDANASAKIKGATSVSTFVMNSGLTLNGILVCSVASGTSGILWATGSFDTTVEVINLDEVKVTYGVRL